MGGEKLSKKKGKRSVTFGKYYQKQIKEEFKFLNHIYIYIYIYNYWKILSFLKIIV